MDSSGISKDAEGIFDVARSEVKESKMSLKGALMIKRLKKSTKDLQLLWKIGSSKISLDYL